jgi:single-stranded-DNA-specific exonuclease
VTEAILSGMLQPRHRWRFPRPVTIPDDLSAEAARAGLSLRVIEVLVRRGLLDAAELRSFLGDPRDALHDPRLLPDADLFLDRIRLARARGEGVLVFGDFDADGLSGLATMTLALRRLGLHVEPYVPSRVDEGHGLSMRAVETAATAGLRLIVTVDCGSTSVAEIADARGRGIDVLVTDHHRVPSQLPEAVAIVNPHRPDSTYPDRRLTGSGVAFKAAQLVLADEPGGPEAALALAELATIGTVSDIAPILGENRAIARLGLDRMRTSPRPGVAALLAEAGLARDRVDLESVAFTITPRINAAGRVGDALDAARLLLTEDPDEAARLATALETNNSTRRDVARRSLEEATALLEAGTRSDGPVVVRGPWPVGIVGLVAGRLAEETGRPTVVGADVGSVVRASCRSDGAVDLAAALESCTDLLIRHGGHAGAAGFEIEAVRWDAFRERFTAIVGASPVLDARREVALDLALPAADVDYALFRELALMAPTGPGNPDPLVGVFGITVGRARPANGGHTQLTLRRERDVLDGIAFGRSDLAEELHEGDRIDLVARLASRTFGGFESLQLEIRDVAPAGFHEGLGAAPARPTEAAPLLAAPMASAGARS